MHLVYFENSVRHNIISTELQLQFGTHWIGEKKKTTTTTNKNQSNMGLYFRGQNVGSAYFVMRSINFLSTTEKLVDKICSKQQGKT